MSSTVRDLVAGSGLRFAEEREVEIEGIAGRRVVFPVLIQGVGPDAARRLAIEQANLLRRDGEYWTVAYDGKVAALRDTKGMRDLARLLASPHRELHVLDLAVETGPSAALPGREATHDADLHVEQSAIEPYSMTLLALSTSSASPNWNRTSPMQKRAERAKPATVLVVSSMLSSIS